MNSTMNDPVDWLELGSWFREAETIKADLLASASLVQSMAGGDPVSNVTDAEALMVRARHAVLVRHLSVPGVLDRRLPGVDRGRPPGAGRVHAAHQGHGRRHRRALRGGAACARLMIAEFTSIAGKLHVYAGIDAQYL